MTHHHLRDPQTVKEITSSYEVGTMSVEDLAIHYGVSTTSIRKILAEAGLVKMRTLKTKEQQAMLDYLHLHGITSLDKLKTRLLTISSAKTFYSQQSIETRVSWLHQSIQEGKSHENHDSLQQPQHHTGSVTRNQRSTSYPSTQPNCFNGNGLS